MDHRHSGVSIDVGAHLKTGPFRLVPNWEMGIGAPGVHKLTVYRHCRIKICFSGQVEKGRVNLLGKGFHP